ncbi:cellulase family glycosylhydrolase [Pseudoxanthomonas sp. SL93]|uniref:cellulase family glycosylhydrolase n=1 Tax=Pseudoxanthomonas sp. SL93 TaxID=2995142 RepID=UPI00226E14E8|nr:cellulase family glycosylhydrolase [Pseudoxanthomonas sp. SL93]WAC61903.1 cellulase family glycosylhydrolase [Pseudoxanthomonas sp. SL93]
MKRTALLLLAGLAVMPYAQAKDFLRTQGTRIVDEAGKPVILRGMGLGGWMLQEGYMLDIDGVGTQRSIHARIADLIGPEKAEAFYQAWRDNHTTRADIDAMARWGFNSVRLPMHYALYTLPVEQEPVAGGQTWVEEGFRRTDELLAWAKANDLYLILDLHAAPGGQGNDNNIADRDPTQPSLWDDSRHQDKMVALWTKLAQRYRDEPYIAAYDIINEPNWGFADKSDTNGCKENGNAPLKDLLVRTTRAIREVDTRHIIVIEGNCWGNNYRGVLEDGPWDDNLVISFHKYWNVTTRDSIAELLALRDKHRMPLWLGETGENSNDWFARTVALVEGEGIGWAWWPLKKIRYNNPLQVVPNDGYRRVLAYWKGEGPRPSREDAEAALMRFASHDVRYENNVQHPDVVDALFRAPHADAPLPFRPHVIGAQGGQIAAVDFDMGRNGVAYHDLTPANQHISDGGERVVWNPAMTYRNDGVDLGKSADGSLFVADMRKGEWLKYTFTVTEPGRYRLLPATRRAGRLSLVLDGQPAAEIEPGATVDLQLRAGPQTLQVRAESDGIDLETLRFSR